MYAPTNHADEEAKDIFYEQVQNTLVKIPKHDIVMLMGDWNGINKMVKIEGVVGRERMGKASSNSEQATIWLSQQLCFPTRISTSTHGYHQTPATPRTRLIM